MAKITSQTMEIRVCAQDSYSPVTISQTIELAPDETQVPEQLEKWCLEHMRTIAVAYAKALRADIVPEVVAPQPSQPNVNVQYSYNNGNPNGYQNTTYGTPSNMQGGGYNEVEALLSTPIPPELFGKTKPTAFANYGYTLRACSAKELNYLAFENNKARNQIVGLNAKRLVELGYRGV